MTSAFNQELWNQLVQFSILYPIDWTEHEKLFEIKKLELEKFQIKQITDKKSQFEKKYYSDHHINKSWMENQYRLFIWFIFTYSKIISIPLDLFTQAEWRLVSECFNKDALFCQYFYLSSKKTKSAQWRIDEDVFVQKMMNTSFNKKWTQIGLELFIRSNGIYFKKPKSIRERWLSHLNPDIKKDDWSLKQDSKLITLIKEKGRKWSKIAKILGNRTEHAVKNRYNQLLYKFQKEQLNQKINFANQTEQQKLNIIQSSIEKMKSEQTLPESSSEVRCTNIEELQVVSLKIFNPIILTTLSETSISQQKPKL